MSLLKKVKHKILTQLKCMDLDGIILCQESDLQYLFGFATESSKVLIKKNGQVIFFIDSMNYGVAKSVIYPSVVNDGFRIVSGSPLYALTEEIKKSRMDKVGIDQKSILLYENDFLCKSLKKVKFMYASYVLELIRANKMDHEIDIIRKAAYESIEILKTFSAGIRTNMREKEIAAFMDILIREKGYINSFTTIAACGENSAYPHAIAGDKIFISGEHLLVDFGIKFNGYCSDLTRTFYKGRINRQIKHFDYHVRKAQDLAIKKMKPGIKAATLAKITNDYFKKNNLYEFVLHGLGHGVGLDVHERPFLGSGGQDYLKKGMILTVEPGLYKEGLGGVRIEDMAVVTKNGCEVLTK